MIHQRWLTLAYTINHLYMHYSGHTGPGPTGDFIKVFKMTQCDVEMTVEMVTNVLCLFSVAS